tara:strand:+ start:6190 stop:7596 length:1407 start_codon:yes stop_codon:yes gene_type:complete
MKIISNISKCIIVIGCFLIWSCEDFVEVETPDYFLTTQNVYNNDESADRALRGMLNQLFNISFANGSYQSVSFLGGLSADNYDLYSNSQELISFYYNNIPVNNNNNLSLWSGAYNAIYQSNALLEGVRDNSDLSTALVNKIEGVSRFVRAFTYFHLLNLYDEVPLILTTDYQSNALASETDRQEIYNQIILDLETASELLSDSYADNDRTVPNTYACYALLARVHLFLENYQAAEDYSSFVIQASDQYTLLSDFDMVFLADSEEAIWQISPIGWGTSFTHTRDGNALIKTPTVSTPLALSRNFLESYDPTDLRLENWVDYIIQNEDTLFYPYKYKIQYENSGEITEYSMVMRFAEQYLIRAEARTMLSKFAQAIEDINTIRERSGISPISNTEDSHNQDLILQLVINERRKELFSEWGHRWFDLVRFEMLEELSEKNNSEFSTPRSWLFPIPDSERERNPNLNQNPGY